jgi:hypothetical protein
VKKKGGGFGGVLGGLLGAAGTALGGPLGGALGGYVGRALGGGPGYDNPEDYETGYIPMTAGPLGEFGGNYGSVQRQP